MFCRGGARAGLPRTPRETTRSVPERARVTGVRVRCPPHAAPGVAFCVAGWTDGGSISPRAAAVALREHTRTRTTDGGPIRAAKE